MKKSHFLLLLSVFFLLTGKTSGQQASSPAPKLNHIALFVYDLKASTDFYKDVLQLKVIPEPFNDGKHTWFDLGNAIQLHLIQGADPGKNYYKNSHMCFTVNAVEDFITMLDKYKIDYTNVAGNSKTPTKRVDGVKQIYFKDPDGYWIEVNDDRRL